MSIDKDQSEIKISFILNGSNVQAKCRSTTHLADMLRNIFQLTGIHTGCEHGVCGSCNVMLNGKVVRGCLTLAVQIEGAEVQTIEGLTQEGTISDLQDEFVKRNALQCGFCTPGMLMTAAELLQDDTSPSREEIREAISGNYCRCTGYQAIVDAIGTVAQQRQEGRTADE